MVVGRTETRSPLAVSPRAVPGPELTAAVRQVLVDSSFREAAARVRALYARTDGAGTAAEAILERLGQGTSTGRVGEVGRATSSE